MFMSSILECGPRPRDDAMQYMVYEPLYHFKIWKDVKSETFLDPQISDEELQNCKRLNPHCHWKLQQSRFKSQASQSDFLSL